MSRTEQDEFAERISEEEERQISAAQKDPQAFGLLYDRYLQQVYRYLLSRLSNPDEAQDITSLTFLKAYEAFPRYRHKGNFVAWLFQIARNKYIDHVRHSIVSNNMEMEIINDPCSDPPLDQALQKERLTALRRLLFQLSEADQELLRLRYVAELSFSDVAALTGRKKDAVKKGLYRLVARLQSQLEEKNG